MTQLWIITAVADVARSARWYQRLVEGFSEAIARARSLVPALSEEPHVNPATGTEEFALHDPDGYYVMVSAIAAA